VGRLVAGNAGAPFEALPSFFVMDSSIAHFKIDVLRQLVAGNDFGRDLRYVPETDSTNRMAAELKPGNWRNGTSIITDHQTSGRGRNGRAWDAPPGTALLMSVLLSPVRAAAPSNYVMLVALAVGDAVKEATGIHTFIKWPNDIQVGGRKLAGVLLERKQRDYDTRVIAGIGINANIPVETVQKLGPAATSLLAETGQKVSRESLAAALLHSLGMWYRNLTLEPDAVFEAWKGRVDTVGAELDVIEATGVWSGKALDVQRDGGLIVERAGGERRTVYAADVSVRPRPHLQLP
jgi:BirA family transcriptional regulator, biotin operon repressor / biotin---[acetyl-CoA-carboxylase] ligase